MGQTCVRRGAATAAMLLGTIAAGLSAPNPLESGWSVRKVADGFSQNFNGLAYDPVSTDLFVTDYSASTIYRVTQAGVKTAIYSATDIAYDEMAFNPVTRRIYFGGVAQTNLRVIDEFGNFIKDVTSPNKYTGLAFAPDGYLYVNSAFTNEISRFDDTFDTFTVVHTGVGTSTLEGLGFDALGNAYVAEYDSGEALKVDPGGTVTNLGAVFNIIGSTFGDGSMFATDYGGGNIWRIDPSGGGITKFADGHISSSGLNFASNGRLYVNADGLGALYEYSYVPEPSTILGLGAGLSLLAGARRRRR